MKHGRAPRSKFSKARKGNIKTVIDKKSRNEISALFNMCPQGLRDMESDHQDRFKENFDAWLHGIPDQPSIPGCSRTAISSSLLPQVPFMMQQFDNP